MRKRFWRCISIWCCESLLYLLGYQCETRAKTHCSHRS
jgi:hypothetical protein